MVHVGIDWADKFHWLCIVDDQGEKLCSLSFAHSQEGFEKAQDAIVKHSAGGEARIAIETKDSLLVDFLLELGYSLFFLSPKQTDRFRDRHRLSTAISDSFDAYVLADAVRTDVHLFRMLPPLDGVSLRLRVLTRSRERLVKRKVAVQNEITSHLKRYFPVALELFGGTDNAEAIAFLLECPTHEQAKAVSKGRIESVLKKPGGASPAIAKRHAARVYTKLREPQMSAAPNVVDAYPFAVQSLLRQLASILEEIAVLEQQIADIYKDHANKDIIESLPGVAEVLGPVIAAEVGEDISRFGSAKTLKAFVGSSPVTRRSGGHREVLFRRACNRHLRRALHLASLASLITAEWAKELFDRLRSEGKSYGRALRAVADQIIEMLYIMLSRRTLYDEEYHRRMKALHGQAR